MCRVKWWSEITLIWKIEMWRKTSTRWFGNLGHWLVGSWAFCSSGFQRKTSERHHSLIWHNEWRAIFREFLLSLFRSNLLNESASSVFVPFRNRDWWATQSTNCCFNSDFYNPSDGHKSFGFLFLFLFEFQFHSFNWHTKVIADRTQTIDRNKWLLLVLCIIVVALEFMKENAICGTHQTPP